MIDFVAIRRRAESLQESSGLGTPEYAVSQDIFALLDALKASNVERDDARDLHRKVNALYIGAHARLIEIRSSLERWKRDHPPITHEEFIANGYRQNHEVTSREREHQEMISQNGAFVGPVPHA